jgi:outer membrane lipopolysaccharide assembly protein LptE/RlpB
MEPFEVAKNRDDHYDELIGPLVRMWTNPEDWILRTEPMLSSSRPRVSGTPRHSGLESSAVLWVLLLVIGGSSLSGCAFYSFTGANIPSHLETIAIPIAEDNTSSPITNLGRTLTGILTDRFVGRTSFSLNNNETNADAVLQTRITRYSNQPTGVSGDEQATANEVRIQVQVRYYDQVRDSTMVDQSFTGSATYNPAEAGLAGEEEAAQVALERVGEDIFTTATSDW